MFMSLILPKLKKQTLPTEKITFACFYPILLIALFPYKCSLLKPFLVISGVLKQFLRNFLQGVFIDFDVTFFDSVTTKIIKTNLYITQTTFSSALRRVYAIYGKKTSKCTLITCFRAIYRFL